MASKTMVCRGSEDCAETHCQHYYMHMDTGEYCETGLCPVLSKRVSCRPHDPILSSPAQKAVTLTTNRKADIEKAGKEIITLLTGYHFTNDELLFILRGLAESLEDVVKDVEELKKWAEEAEG